LLVVDREHVAAARPGGALASSGRHGKTRFVEAAESRGRLRFRSRGSRRSEGSPSRRSLTTPALLSPPPSLPDGRGGRPTRGMPHSLVFVPCRRDFEPHSLLFERFGVEGMRHSLPVVAWSRQGIVRSPFSVLRSLEGRRRREQGMRFDRPPKRFCEGGISLSPEGTRRRSRGMSCCSEPRDTKAQGMKHSLFANRTKCGECGSLAANLNSLQKRPS